MSVEDTEYNLKLSGELTFNMSDNTINITCGNAKFKTFLKGTGKVTIEWNSSQEDAKFQIPTWDPNKKILVDQYRFMYTLDGKVYGKIAEVGSGVRPLNDAEKSMLVSKKIPIVNTATNVLIVRQMMNTTREEKFLADKYDKIKKLLTFTDGALVDDVLTVYSSCDEDCALSNSDVNFVV